MIGAIGRWIERTNNAVLAIGATAGAVTSIVAVVVLVEPGATPAVRLAQAQVESDHTLLEQYVSLHQPGSASALEGARPPRPVLDYETAAGGASPSVASPPAASASPSAQPRVRLAVYVAPAANAQPATGPVSSGGGGGSTGGGSGGEDPNGGPTGPTGPTGMTGTTGTTGQHGGTGPSGASGAKGPTAQERREKREAVEATTRQRRREREAQQKRRKKAHEEEERRRRKGPTGPTSNNTGGPEHGGVYIPPHPPKALFHQEGGAKVLVGTGVSTGAVDKVLAEVQGLFAGERISSSVQSRCGDSCALRPLIDQAIETKANPAEAAREIAGIFRDTRSVNYENRPEPVGVTVEYAIDFSHYVGKSVEVMWTLDSRATGRPLPRSWWRNVIAKQVEPTSDEPYRGNFWAPLPRRKGDYYVTLRLFAGEHELGSIPTGVFH